VRSVLPGLAVAALVLAGSGAYGTAAAAPRTTRAPSRLHLPSPLPSRTVDVPILMYHRIDKADGTLPEITRSLTVDPRTFKLQMLWLARHGRHTITQRQLFDALMHGARLPRRPVMITFDDGYADVYEKAMPTLYRLGMHATSYVITDRISGGDPAFVTWRMLRGFERHGVEIGSHTVSHLDLTSLSEFQAMSQLGVSRRRLEERLGHPVQWLSYPGGANDARIVAFAKKTGYVLAVTTDPGEEQHADDPLRLKRFRILDTTGVAGLAALLG
jgi:peptidoglycan/xylan/chitin deacetylase (PgdA/CDA1 family)